MRGPISGYPWKKGSSLGRQRNLHDAGPGAESKALCQRGLDSVHGYPNAYLYFNPHSRGSDTGILLGGAACHARLLSSLWSQIGTQPTLLGQYAGVVVALSKNLWAEMDRVPLYVGVPSAGRGLCSWFGSVNLIPQYLSYLKVVSDHGHVQRR